MAEHKRKTKKVENALPNPLKPAGVIHTIGKLITANKYLFDPHAEKRFIERGIQPLQVIEILKGHLTHDSNMNEFSSHFDCWTYAVFGKNKEFELKIVVGIKDKHALIITVAKVKNFKR